MFDLNKIFTPVSVDTVIDSAEKGVRTATASIQPEAARNMIDAAYDAGFSIARAVVAANREFADTVQTAITN